MNKEESNLKASTSLPQETDGGERQIQNTTEYLDDAAVISAGVHQAPLDYNYLRHSAIVPPGEVKGFLSKPEKLVNGEFTTTDTASTFLWYTVPQTMITLLKRNKLEGYFGFRATMVFRIQFNATRFQQGRYMLCYMPSGGASATLGYSNWRDAHASTLVQRTQLPHVEFDLNQDTKAELRIPFSSTFDFYPLRANAITGEYAAWGDVRIFPYSPLVASSGLSTASYTLWAYFEDVELIGSAQPQIEDFRMLGEPVSQMATEEEQKNAGVGPIESVATKVSSAMDILNPVPFLRDFVTPVKWVADIVGGVASVFGWSAPINLEHGYRVVRNPAMYATNVNKVDNSMPLSLWTDNEVTVHPSFAFDEADELDIVKICMRPAYFTQFSWTNTQNAGDNLFAIGVRPSDSLNTRTIGTTTVTDYTPCQFVASLFNYWRGSMVYTFKFIKTEYHSGRVAIVFFPEERQAGSVPSRSYNASDYVLREIVDIRQHNEITISVPYMGSTPYKPLRAGVTNNSKTGTIAVYVVDELVAPDTVPSTVTVLCEMSMGPDAEFFAPFITPRTASMRATIQMADFMMYDKSDHSFKSGVIGGARQPQNQVDTSAICVGEKTTNLRALLRKFHSIVPTSANTNAVTPNTTTYVFPYAFQVSDQDTDDSALFNNDLYGMLASIYCYSRGGVRLKVKDSTAANTMRCAYLYDFTHQQQVPSTYLVDTNTFGVDTFEDGDAGKYNFVLQDGREEKIMEVQVPMYSMYHSRANAGNFVGTTGVQDVFKEVRARMLVAVQEYGNEGTKDTFVPRVLRAGADDCNFGGFISIPPFASY